MTWDDTYRDHEIWQNAKIANEELATTIAQQESQAADESFQLQALLSHVEGCSDSPHPSISQAHLDQVNTTVSQIRNLLPDRLDAVFTRSGGQLSPFLSLAQAVRSWPVPGGSRLNGLGKRADAVEQTFLALDRQISTRLEELEHELTKSNEETTHLLVQHKADTNEAAKAATFDLNQKMATIAAELERIKKDAAAAEATTENQKARLDEALNTHQERFSELQEQRTANWNNFLSENQGRIDEHMALMAEHEEQSRNVLAAVGVNATASDYEAYATAQAKIADRWRIAAVVAFTIAAFYFLTAAGMSFFGFGGELTWWEMVFQKIGAPGGAAAVGYFLQRESAQHRKQEREAKQVQLTLTALEPFIANLEPVEQRSIRMDTARDIFTRKRGASIPTGKADQLEAAATATE